MVIGRDDRLEVVHKGSDSTQHASAPIGGRAETDCAVAESELGSNSCHSTAHYAQLGVISRTAVSGNSIPITSMVTGIMDLAKRNVVPIDRIDANAIASPAQALTKCARFL